MKNLYFKPRIGEHYNEGLNNVRILVLGASHYCTKNECPVFKECTSTEIKDSRFNGQDRICKKDGTMLSDYTINELGYFLDGDSDIKTYQKFTNFMIEKGFAKSKEDLWSHVAFYNYVQFVLPQTETDFLSDRDYEALKECIKSLPNSPDLIIIWGKPVGDKIKENKQDSGIEKADSNYIFKHSIADKEFFCCNCHHHSYRYFEDGDKFKKQLSLCLDHIKKQKKE